MKIDNATVHRLQIPLNDEYKISGSNTSVTDSILVVLEAEGGERGIGTADPIVGHAIPQSPDEIYTSLTDQLLPAIVTDPPTNPNALRIFLEGFPGKENARCAVETAYLDLYCRQRDQTLADFMGGKIRDNVSLNGWIGIGSPEEMANEAKRLEEKGFKSFKMKVDGNIELDAKRVETVCDSVDDMGVRIDANEAYPNADTAIESARTFEDYPVEYLEQPISRSDFTGMKKVTNSTNLDIMADESISTCEDGYQYLSEHAADRLKFKILQSGGTMNVRQGLDMASAAGVSCVVGHGFCTSPAASAELQLTASHSNIFGSVETVGPLKIKDQPFERIDISNGGAKVPTGPGLGVKLLDDTLPDFIDKSTNIRRTT